MHLKWCVNFFFQKNFFEDSVLDKEDPPKRILRKNETHRFYGHFRKPPETPGKCCFGGWSEIFSEIHHVCNFMLIEQLLIH